MPEVAIYCPFCDELLHVSSTQITIPFVTKVITDVWPPATLHVCRKAA